MSKFLTKSKYFLFFPFLFSVFFPHNRVRIQKPNKKKQNTHKNTFDRITKTMKKKNIFFVKINTYLNCARDVCFCLFMYASVVLSCVIDTTQLPGTRNTDDITHLPRRSKTFRWHVKQATVGRRCKTVIYTIWSN